MHDDTIMKAIELGYEPYEGAAGPSNEQVEKNNKVLLKLVTDAGVKAEYVKHPDSEMFAEDLMTIKVGKRTCDFDRWGFAGKDFETGLELDQVGIAAAVRFLIK